ncbi:hypothetical protein Tco_1136098 [Tanacetum coccineum]
MFDEYVQPLLNRKNELEQKNQGFFKQINNLNNRLRKAGQTNQTLRMLLPKEDNVNTGKHGLGFENKKDDENPTLLNKAKALAPFLYNIDEMGKELIFDHKIISEEELNCKAEKSLKAMLKYEKEIVSKQNLPQEIISIILSFEDNVKRIARIRLSKKFKPLVKEVNLQLNCFEDGLVKEMKEDLKYVMSLEDEFDETCLILDIQQEYFKNQLESIKQAANVKEEMTK